jgi:hypothetical protein
MRTGLEVRMQITPFEPGERKPNVSFRSVMRSGANMIESGRCTDVRR